MSVDGEHGEAVDEEEDRIESLKQQKAKDKSAFTRIKNKLLSLLDEEDYPSRREVKAVCQKLCEVQERTMSTMEELSQEYLSSKEKEKRKKLTNEMDRLEADFSEAHDKAQEYLENRKDELSSLATDASENTRRRRIEERVVRKSVEKEVLEEQVKREQDIARQKEDLEELRRQYRSHLFDEEDLQDLKQSEFKGPETSKFPANNGAESRSTPSLGKDMWNQLKRVSIPVFNGDKRLYEGWKTAFMACVDRAPATPEYKLLQLRQYLSGEALKVVEPLGHSAAAYETAKERLERKFGGKRRQIALHLEELENFKPLRPGNARDLERLADLLDVTVVNLKEAGRHDELGSGSLYLSLCKKLTEAMLAHYHRWIHENGRWQSVETLREFIIQEAEFQTVASETIHGLSKRGHKKDSGVTLFGNAQKSSGNQRRDGFRPCKVCGGHHGVWRCDKFKAMSPPARWEAAKSLKLCYRCLGGDHNGETCVRSRICGINNCKNTHNRLLHRDSAPAYQSEQLNTHDRREMEQGASGGSQAVAESETSNETSLTPPQDPVEQATERSHTTVTSQSAQPRFVALRTVPVFLKNGNRKIKVNALLDEASTKTYLNADVAAELGLQGHPQSVTVNVLNGQTETFETTPVEVELESLDGNTKTTISAFTAERVTGNMKVINWGKYAAKCTHLKGIQFPNPGIRPIVDLLIGVDYAELHYSFKDVRGQPGEPVARLTPLGWTCTGTVSGLRGGDYQSSFAHTYFVREHSDADEISGLLRQFWEIENPRTSRDRTVLNPDEQCALEQVEKSLKYLDGRYQVALPWKENVPDLPDNYDMALRRLYNTEKRLLKNPEIAAAYSENITQYLEKGYIHKIDPTEEKPARRWYLPHFPVVRLDRATTKTRIVFDASAKFGGISLNDVIHQGPKLQRDLNDVLLRFRRHPVALICDIAEMYLRIEVAPKDRSCQRFLWRSLDQQRKPEEYEFNRVVFGINSSPFQAQFVSQTHAEKHKDELPLAAEAVSNSTYMDDSMDSLLDDSQGIELYKQLDELWSKAGMHARKWLSNSSQVLEKIPIKDRASEVDINKDPLPTVKTLGITWLPEDDVFTFKSNPPEENFQITKRNFLKKIATLFDPVGFLAPFTIRAKVMMQEMWVAGLEWDELCPRELIHKSREWFCELEELQTIKVPRCLRFGPEEVVLSQTLHTFVDASQDAYGAVVYLKVMYGSGSVSSRLVAAKTRVAPLAATSIPRLELMAAILGLRLTESVSRVYSGGLGQAVFWSDSMNVLWWIRGRSRIFKPFVANRVGEIQSLTNPKQWRFVPTNENPADFTTRGMRISDLAKENKWWSGPDFLQKEESDWPVNQIDTNRVSAATEIKKTAQASSQAGRINGDWTVISVHEDDQLWRLDPKRYSSWTKLIRIQAWVRRFIDNCRSPNREKGELIGRGDRRCCDSSD